MLATSRSVNFRLWLAIILTALLPSIYSTIRIYFLNDLPDTWNLSIAAQSAWLNLSYEVLQEALLLPLFYILGQVVRDRAALKLRVTYAFYVTLAAYIALTTFVLFGADWLSGAMAQQDELVALTASYIRLEAIAKVLSTLTEICIIVVVVLSWGRLLLWLVLLRSVLTIFFDSLFVSQFQFSLNLGVLGVAWTNIAVALFMLIPTLLILGRLGVLGLSIGKTQLHWRRDWFRVAARSGMESAVRNLAFSLMILRLMNEVQEAGLFWVTNGFIWGWLLLPILTLGTLIRQDTATHAGRIGQRFRAYLAIVTIIVCIWIATIPLWGWFIANAMGSNEAERIVSLTLIMLIFYIAFAYNHVLDSYLYGMGRTDLMLYQSLFVSVFYYGSAFVAYRIGVFAPDLTQIALLFGGGILVDSALTLFQFHRARYFKTATTE